MNSVADIWKKVLDTMAERTTPVALNTWFDDCSAIELKENQLILYTPANFKKGIIEGRFFPEIRAILSDMFSCDFDVILLCEDDMAAYKARSEITDESDSY